MPAKTGGTGKTMMRENHPSISTVITTYQRPDFAMRAARSALAQDYPNHQVFVIEDGSETGLKKQLSELAGNAIHYIAHSENKGLAAARNTGIQSCNGDYVAFLDDDDEWMADKLSQQAALALESDERCACIYCAAEIVDRSGHRLGENRPRLRGSIRSEIQRVGLHTIPSSCLFKRDALVKIGGYDDTLRSHIDHDIWMRLSRHDYYCDFVNTLLVRAHEHNNKRITNNMAERISATRQFCDNWKPELSQWYGEKGATRYLTGFQSRVYHMLGLNFAANGRKMMAFLFYCKALRFDLTNKKCRRQLFNLYR